MRPCYTIRQARPRGQIWRKYGAGAAKHMKISHRIFFSGAAEIRKFLLPAGCQIQGASLVFTWPKRPRWYRPPAGLALRFAKITDESAALRFASRYGPLLGPASHDIEDIADWIGYARVVDALLRMGKYLGTQQPDDSAAAIALQHFVFGNQFGEQFPMGEDLDAAALRKAVRKLAPARTLIAAAVQKLLDAGGCRVSAYCDGSVVRLIAMPESLLACLAVQVVNLLLAAPGVQICSGCGRAFRLRQDRPRGVRRFCAACRRAKIPQRMAERDYRARRKA